MNPSGWRGGVTHAVPFLSVSLSKPVGADVDLEVVVIVMDSGTIMAERCFPFGRATSGCVPPADFRRRLVRLVALRRVMLLQN